MKTNSKVKKNQTKPNGMTQKRVKDILLELRFHIEDSQCDPDILGVNVSNALSMLYNDVLAALRILEREAYHTEIVKLTQELASYKQKYKKLKEKYND